MHSLSRLYVVNKGIPCFSVSLLRSLFSNRSEMTKKCGKNKKVAREAIAKCH